MSEKQFGAVFKFKPEDIKSFMGGNRLASMASNSVGEQLVERLKEVDRPCEVRVVVSVALDFITQPEGTVLKETKG